MSTDNTQYGRKWRVLVTTASPSGGSAPALEVSASDFEPEALKAQFHVSYPGYQAFAYGEVTIFNLRGDTEQQLITEGCKVIIEAGYQKAQYGKIFEGYVIQPLRDRQNVTDHHLTLNCAVSDILADVPLVKFTTNVGQDTRGLWKEICKNAGLSTGYISDGLDTASLPRGKTYFGNAQDYLRDIAVRNNARWYVVDDLIHITRAPDVPKGSALVLSPTTGLIGTPQQIDYGVTFKCLLNPSIKVMAPPMLVKLDNSQIRGYKTLNKQTVTPLDQDGLYQVLNVTHYGDTRGNEWYTEVIGVNSQTGVQKILPEYMNNVNSYGLSG